MKIKMSDKARAAMNRVVDRFKNGTLSEIVDVARLKLPEDAPAAKWTFTNRALAYAQTGCLDNRNYRAWQRAGRQVQKGSSAAFIWKPLKFKKTDDDGNDRFILYGFTTTDVHPYTNTAVIPGREDKALQYEPNEPPPLADVARKLGVKFNWTPTAGCYGWCRPDGSELRAGTHDVGVFFHELAHAVDARLNGENGRLQGGQHVDQETVADFTAAVLMEYYDLGDRSGNCWKYLSMYADDPLEAVKNALDRIGKIVAYIEELTNDRTND